MRRRPTATNSSTGKQADSLSDGLPHLNRAERLGVIPGILLATILNPLMLWTIAPMIAQNRVTHQDPPSSLTALPGPPPIDIVLLSALCILLSFWQIRRKRMAYVASGIMVWLLFEQRINIPHAQDTARLAIDLGTTVWLMSQSSHLFARARSAQNLEPVREPVIRPALARQARRLLVRSVQISYQLITLTRSLAARIRQSSQPPIPGIRITEEQEQRERIHEAAD